MNPPRIDPVELLNTYHSTERIHPLYAIAPLMITLFVLASLAVMHYAPPTIAYSCIGGMGGLGLVSGLIYLGVSRAKKAQELIEQSKAATRIQAVFRGFREKKAFREQKKAAQTLQNAYRDYRAKKNSMNWKFTEEESEKLVKVYDENQKPRNQEPKKAPSYLKKRTLENAFKMRGNKQSSAKRRKPDTSLQPPISQPLRLITTFTPKKTRVIKTIHSSLEAALREYACNLTVPKIRKRIIPLQPTASQKAFQTDTISQKKIQKIDIQDSLDKIIEIPRSAIALDSNLQFDPDQSVISTLINEIGNEDEMKKILEKYGKKPGDYCLYNDLNSYPCFMYLDQNKNITTKKIIIPDYFLGYNEAEKNPKLCYPILNPESKIDPATLHHSLLGLKLKQTINSFEASRTSSIPNAVGFLHNLFNKILKSPKKIDFLPYFLIKVLGNILSLPIEESYSNRFRNSEDVRVIQNYKVDFTGFQYNIGRFMIVQDLLNYLPNSDLLPDIKNKIRLMCENSTDILTKTTISSSDLLKQLQDGNPITIATGWEGHSVNLTLTKSHLIFTNRGERTDASFESAQHLYQITQPITVEILNQLTQVQTKQFFPNSNQDSELENLLGLQSQEALHTTNQKNGNCTLANNRLCFKAAMILLGVDPALIKKEHQAFIFHMQKYWLEIFFELQHKMKSNLKISNDFYFTALCITTKILSKRIYGHKINENDEWILNFISNKLTAIPKKGNQSAHRFYIDPIQKAIKMYSLDPIQKVLNNQRSSIKKEHKQILENYLPRCKQLYEDAKESSTNSEFIEDALDPNLQFESTQALLTALINETGDENAMRMRLQSYGKTPGDYCAYKNQKSELKFLYLDQAGKIVNEDGYIAPDYFSGYSEYTKNVKFNSLILDPNSNLNPASIHQLLETHAFEHTLKAFENPAFPAMPYKLGLLQNMIRRILRNSDKVSLNPQIIFRTLGQIFSLSIEGLELYPLNCGRATIMQDLFNYFPNSNLPPNILTKIQLMCENARTLYDDENSSFAETLLEQLQNGAPITIFTGWTGHSVNLTLTNTHLIFTNRGEKTDDSFLATQCLYTIGEPITLDILTQLLQEQPKSFFPNSQNNGGIEKLLGLQQVKDFYPSDQKSPNCVFANNRLCFKAAMILLSVDEELINKEHKAFILQTQINWLSMLFELKEKLILTSQQSQELDFIILCITEKFLSKQSYDSTRTEGDIELHNLIEEKISRETDALEDMDIDSFSF